MNQGPWCSFTFQYAARYKLTFPTSVSMNGGPPSWPSCRSQWDLLLHLMQYTQQREAQHWKLNRFIKCHLNQETFHVCGACRATTTCQWKSTSTPVLLYKSPYGVQQILLPGAENQQLWSVLICSFWGFICFFYVLYIYIASRITGNISVVLEHRKKNVSETQIYKVKQVVSLGGADFRTE